LAIGYRYWLWIFILRLLQLWLEVILGFNFSNLGLDLSRFNLLGFMVGLSRV